MYKIRSLGKNSMWRWQHLKMSRNNQIFLNVYDIIMGDCISYNFCVPLLSSVCDQYICLWIPHTIVVKIEISVCLYWETSIVSLRFSHWWLWSWWEHGWTPCTSQSCYCKGFVVLQWMLSIRYFLIGISLCKILKEVHHPKYFLSTLRLNKLLPLRKKF